MVNSTQVSESRIQAANGFGVTDLVSVGDICFSIKSLHFFASGSDFKMPVSASRRVLDLPFATPLI